MTNVVPFRRGYDRPVFPGGAPCVAWFMWTKDGDPELVYEPMLGTTPYGPITRSVQHGAIRIGDVPWVFVEPDGRVWRYTALGHEVDYRDLFEFIDRRWPPEIEARRLAKRWGRQFARDLIRDIPAIPPEVSRKIARKLRRRIARAITPLIADARARRRARDQACAGQEESAGGGSRRPGEVEAE